MTNQPSDKQAFERLRNEVTDLLLDSNSPARDIPELKSLIDEHQELVQRQAELKALEAKIAEVLPVVEQTESNVAAAEKQVLAEKKQLASFAGELGQAVFAGFQAGELPDQPFLGPRKDLQAKIDALQQQRSTLLAEEKTTFIDKTKQQAQQLALAGQIKIEELKIGSADRALGEAILASKEKLTLKCSQTESVLKAIVEQQRRITEARDRHAEAVNISTNRNAECAEKLGRTLLSSNELKAELKELKSELSRNTKRQAGIREQVIEAASRSDAALQNIALGPKLTELARLQESIAANRPQLAKTFDSATDQFKKLPAGKRRTAIIGSVIVLGLLFLGVVGRGVFSDNSGSRTMDWINAWEANGAIVESEAWGPGITIKKWHDGMLANLPSPNCPISLDLSGSGITNNGLREIETIEQLSQILLGENDISDQGLTSLSNLENLIEISLRQTKISSNGLKHLAKLKKLKRLYLEGTNVSDTGIEHLLDLKEIKHLDLSRTKITDLGLKAVGKLKSLEFLDLTETAITNAGLENIENMSQLQMLSCDQTQISNLGVLNIVAKFKKLQLLDLNFTNINDAALVFLGDFATETNTLEHLGLVGCRRVSPEGVDALKVKAPKLSVSYEPRFYDTIDTTEPSRVPPTARDSIANNATFRYTLNGQSYTGSINKVGDGEDASELIQYDSFSTKSALTINEEMHLITLVLGVTGDRLHIGEGENGQAITLTCVVGGLSTFDPYDPKHTPHTSVTIEYYSGRDSTDGTKWFGKPASEIPANLQRILVREGNKTFVDFGAPETSGLSGNALYKNFSTEKQLALIRQNIGNANLRFEIGNSSFRIDEDARRSLYLFDRAVAVVRYRMGARDSASRPTLGD